MRGAENTLPITFLSDYGYEDEFAGVCRGVIQQIAPGAMVIDITHGLPPREIRPAALVLRNALPFMPAGVHLAVVDPGVGSKRRPLALRCADGRLLVGPDNGLLWPAAERFGGVEVAVDIESSPFRLEPVSATFHGRDLFAPVAAHLALGKPLTEAGSGFPPPELVRMTLPTPAIRDGEIGAHAVYVDRFGNMQLNLDGEQMRTAGFEPGGTLIIEVENTRQEAVFVRTFADVPPGELLVHEDSYAAIAIAVNRGSAADRLGAGIDAELRMLRAGRAAAE
jgi:S-adenosylmethionine hydrolase